MPLSFYNHENKRWSRWEYFWNFSEGLFPAISCVQSTSLPVCNVIFFEWSGCAQKYRLEEYFPLTQLRAFNIDDKHLLLYRNDNKRDKWKYPTHCIQHKIVIFDFRCKKMYFCKIISFKNRNLNNSSCVQIILKQALLFIIDAEKSSCQNGQCRNNILAS